MSTAAAPEHFDNVRRFVASVTIHHASSRGVTLIQCDTPPSHKNVFCFGCPVLLLLLCCGYVTTVKLGLVPKELRLVGGGSKNKLWQQIVADVFQLPVR